MRPLTIAFSPTATTITAHHQRALLPQIDCVRRPRSRVVTADTTAPDSYILLYSHLKLQAVIRPKNSNGRIFRLSSINLLRMTRTRESTDLHDFPTSPFQFAFNT